MNGFPYRGTWDKAATPPGRLGRIGEACGIAALVNLDGRPESGARIGKMIRTMVDRENGLGPEMDDHLWKPVKLEQLSEILQRWLLAADG